MCVRFGNLKRRILLTVQGLLANGFLFLSTPRGVSASLSLLIPSHTVRMPLGLSGPTLWKSQTSEGEESALVPPRNQTDSSPATMSSLLYTEEAPAQHPASGGPPARTVRVAFAGTEEVGRSGSTGAAVAGGGSPDDDLADCIDSEGSLLSQFHEDAIRQSGSGWFQCRVMALVGLGLAADAVEIHVVPLAVPSAEVEFCIEEPRKGWLGAITLLGMVVGGMVWGNLADRMGRRRTLLSALSVGAMFSVIAAFMPTYGTFMTARFFSGFGMGGSLPVTLTYVSEFVPKSDRGRWMCWMLVFWALGGIFVALMAWAIIPRTGLEVVEENSEHFSAWHRFLLVCSLPTLAAIVSLVVFLPESPRYLMEAGRDVEAMLVYQRIYEGNNSGNASPQYQLSELEVPGGKRPPLPPGLLSPPSPGKSVLGDMTHGLEMFRNSFLQLFVAPNGGRTLLLVLAWSSACMAHLGLGAFIPERTRAMEARAFASRARVLSGLSYEGVLFNRSVENVRWSDSHFSGCRFEHVTLSHVAFSNCTLEGCTFAAVRASRTFFLGSSVIGSHFVDTDLSSPRRFLEGCHLANNSVLSLVSSCPRVDVDFSASALLGGGFGAVIVGLLALLPGAVASACLVDRMRRSRLAGVSFILSGLVTLFICFLNSSASLVAFEAVFNFVYVFGWNGLNIATIESYPTHLRATAFGLCTALSRLAAAIGRAIFSALATGEPSAAAPALLSTAALAVSGAASLRLGDTAAALL
ncbi:synaptic vesicle glycoprotein 2B-like isoform X1 [Hetaerina americana]|uniref:synaptic vesicle glycoprotein 2B-like isoform X1 n=2 Tax=Hetaerina americana TaxID=62018 RepID=UPI003A7F1A4B